MGIGIKPAFPESFLHNLGIPLSCAAGSTYNQGTLELVHEENPVRAE